MIVVFYAHFCRLCMIFKTLTKLSFHKLLQQEYFNKNKKSLANRQDRNIRTASGSLQNICLGKYLLKTEQEVETKAQSKQC